MQAPAAVALRSVTKVLGRQAVVAGVDLDIRPGEFFSLLGPSGCGKSTTLRLIAGFETADGGEISFSGTAVNGRPAFLDRVNMVFQNYALFPHLTVRENVAFGLRMQRVPAPERERRVDEMLSLVRLDGLHARLPRQLSGGQQQRVALARALAPRPDVVLLDEPLGALDLQLRKAMQAELKGLQRSLGCTFVYVTHDQEEALTMSDRLAVMHRGHVLQVGAPAEVYERPRTRFVASFIGESNFLEGRLAGGGADRRLRLASGAELALAPVSIAPGAPEPVVGSALAAALRPEKVRLAAERPSDLANVFRARVERSTYFGTDTVFEVVAEGVGPLRVRRQNLAPAGVGAGDEAWVGWSADAVHLLEPEPGEPAAS